ncbi:DNA-binding transcriptional response regulator [Mucilaginibacter paludis]|uniref:Uncharacterized protein n=1 Tax=Mucilaginibacter paludis DSM 18603 TaxID=714943 RepID=H1YAQ0_9SPHI|nr:response regulator [Mucilaginibacter paludis]EHQ29509.1 hypothetical protein Mucpa_5437 [Mucilaginibacter paludis DSM 18603]
MNKKVLVIEDNNDILENMIEILTLAGCEHSRQFKRLYSYIIDFQLFNF